MYNTMYRIKLYLYKNKVRVYITILNRKNYIFTKYKIVIQKTA